MAISVSTGYGNCMQLASTGAFIRIVVRSSFCIGILLSTWIRYIISSIDPRFDFHVRKASYCKIRNKQNPNCLIIRSHLRSLGSSSIILWATLGCHHSPSKISSMDVFLISAKCRWKRIRTEPTESEEKRQISAVLF